MEQRGKVSEITFDRDRRKQQTGQAGNPHQKFQAWRKGKYTSVRYNHYKRSDMEFVQNFTPPDFQAKIFTPSISPNFNSFSKKNTKNE